MIILIAGSTHTGKTLLAQKLMEKYRYPYISIDHLKMGLIRSGYCTLTPESCDNELTEYLWPVIKGIIKTNIENDQNLILEGCYIPFDFKKDFEPYYLQQIKYVCLIFSEKYIEDHFSNIQKYSHIIENRIADEDISLRGSMLEENKRNLLLCKEHDCEYILIEDSYDVDVIL